jgi:hypothetical protein
MLTYQLRPWPHMWRRSVQEEEDRVRGEKRKEIKYYDM